MARLYSGSLSWTYPAGLVLGVMTVGCWVLFAILSRTTVLECELLERTAWLAASAAGPAAFMLPFASIRRPWLRIAVSLACAAIVAALAWYATARLFPIYC